ncbi:MAG: TOBE domain-containing protein [Bacteroidia bacterium]
MNRLKGTITEILSNEGISLVKAQTSNGVVFTSIVIDTPETAGYLKKGNSVNIIFKETEVFISKDSNPNISVQNRVPCIIKSINSGAILCEITLLYGETTIKSIITSNGCKQLGLKENDKVLALIKTNEVSLSPHD